MAGHKREDGYQLHVVEGQPIPVCLDALGQVFSFEHMRRSQSGQLLSRFFDLVLERIPVRPHPVPLDFLLPVSRSADDHVPAGAVTDDVIGVRDDVFLEQAKFPTSIPPGQLAVAQGNKGLIMLCLPCHFLGVEIALQRDDLLLSTNIALDGLHP